MMNKQLRAMWFLGLLGVVAATGPFVGQGFAQNETAESKPSQPNDEVKFFRRTFPDERTESFFNLNQRPFVFELNETPLPFLDWALVETGHVGWIGEKGEVVPLSDPHDYTDEKQISPVPFSVPSGIRIRVQKPRLEEDAPSFLPTTMPWDGRVPHTLIYDQEEGLYHCWYGSKLGTAYAESKDFKTWSKPLTSPVEYENYEKTNVLYISNRDESDEWIFQHPEEVRPGGSGSFFKDPSAPPEERFKTTFVASSVPTKLGEYANRVGKPWSPMVSPVSANCVFGAVSPDGIAWRILKDPILLHDADTMTVTQFDRELERYVTYTRLFELGRRTIARAETDDFRSFPLPDSVIAPGPEDKPYVDFYANSMATYPGIPTLRLIFGLIYDRSIDTSCVRLATSRNGKLWHWLPGEPILEGGERGHWDAYFVRTTPSFVPTPDGRVVIFYSGNTLPHKFPRHRLQSGGWGMASWKKDRLAALEAPERGEFTTCFLTLKRNRLLLNMETERAGEIRVEVLDEKFHPIEGRTLEDADPLNGDSLASEVTWKGESDLSAYRDQNIYLRFKMRAAKLYAIHAAD